MSIYVNQCIIVEGKYDKIKLSSIIDAFIIETDGFGIFKNREKLELIRLMAKKTGIIILTDSDAAGFQIRNFLKGAVKEGQVFHAYTADIFGKEPRKTEPSAEGKLGVEGVPVKQIISALEKSGIFAEQKEKTPDFLSTADLYALNLLGTTDAKTNRRKLYEKMGLPQHMSTSAFLDYVNRVMSEDEFYGIIL